MRTGPAVKVLTLSILGLLIIPGFLPVGTRVDDQPMMASYNPAPANNFHAPLSSVALVALTNATPVLPTSASPSASPNNPSSLKTIQQNSLRFITDNSYFPQSETTIAVDPNNSSHVVGGFNDPKYFFCPFLPSDCAGTIPASLSGFTVSTDGGKSVTKSGSIPNVNATGQILTAWGDPSVAASVDGNFFYASLAIVAGFGIFGNGIMIAKSNSNLFDSSASCATLISDRASNPCWNAMFVNGTSRFPAFNFEDKDRIAVDRSPSSPYYGSVYVAWDHFYPPGRSQTYLARCDNNLVKCAMLSGGDKPVVSGDDMFVSWTTPVVDRNGNVYLSWCNFGTWTTFGPVSCRVSMSPPGGTAFGPVSNILSYMGAGTTLPSATIVIGWATEQYRSAPGLISLAADLSGKSNNLYFTTQVCTSGHYYNFPSSFIFFAADNPGNCGLSSVVLTRSSDNGSTWSSPVVLSDPAVNDQPFVTVDSQTGSLYVVYYSTRYDQFNHRIDVVASVSSNAGQIFHRQRVTSVSSEPNSDPEMYFYLSQFGGSFVVPQYGDYFEATAMGGRLWVLFTGNYQVEAGTFQTDPFLAVVTA